MNKKFTTFLFISLVVLTLVTPFLVFKDLLFPFVTSKAFYFRIVIEAALPFYLFLLLRYPQYRPSLKNPLNIAILAFFLFNLVAGIFGVNPLRSFWGNFERMGGSFYLAHLTLLYFYILMIGQINARYLRFFLQLLVGLGTLVALDGIMVQLTHNHFLLNDPSYPRVSGTFGNPIFIASFLVLPMFLAAFFAVSEEVLWKRIYYWVVVLLQAWVIFLSETRGSVVGMGVGIFLALVVYVILTPSRKLKIWGGSAVVVFGAAVILLFSLHSHLPQNSLLHRVFNLKDSNTEARLIQWGVALKGYKDHPILGVGPENYYFISNKYYNPKIFPYDDSWFDKPHNYLIEVLVTSGVFGFLAYAGMLVISFAALWMAFKKQILLLSEFCILACGLLVYEIQNMFVFDTVAASLAFFIFIGFMGFLWFEAHRPEGATGPKKSIRGFDPTFSYAVFFVSALAMVYLIYVGNITGMKVAAAINYGYAYSSADPQQAKVFFQMAQDSPFDFDPIQFASKYGQAAADLANNPQSQSMQFVSQNLQDAIDAEKSAIAEVPNDPTAWQGLSNLYLTQSIYEKTTLNPEAVTDDQKAMDLAPRRPEPELMMARLDIYQNDNTDAITVLNNILNDIPQESDAKIQLALIYYYGGQVDKAIELGQALLDSGFLPVQANQIDWLGQAYDKEGNFAAAIPVYQVCLNAEPSNLQDQWLLAQDYAKTGNKQQAITLAQQLISEDSKDAQHFQDFINSLK